MEELQTGTEKGIFKRRIRISFRSHRVCIGTIVPRLLSQTFLAPLGMYHTAWFRVDLPPDTSEAIPVEKKNNNGFQDIGHYCFIDYASGSLRTSANDLAIWGNAMLGYGATELWSTDMGREIVKCQERNANNKPINNNNCEFGYGWLLLSNSMKKSTNEKWLKDGFLDYDWTDGIWHDGLEAGSQTRIVILPKAGVYVAVLTNTDLNSETAAQQLTSTVIGAPLPLNQNIRLPPNQNLPLRLSNLRRCLPSQSLLRRPSLRRSLSNQNLLLCPTLRQSLLSQSLPFYPNLRRCAPNQILRLRPSPSPNLRHPLLQAIARAKQNSCFRLPRMNFRKRRNGS